MIFAGLRRAGSRYDLTMGRTALYRDPVPYCPPRAEVQLDADVLVLAMPDGRQRRHALDGSAATLADGFVVAQGARARIDARPERRFVRMLILERDREHHVVITPPDRGAVAPNVVRLPEAPGEAAIVDESAWDVLAEWIMGGGRLAGCSIADLARLATIAAPRFAAVIGEVAAERALELGWAVPGPLRGAGGVDVALHPLVAAARQSRRVRLRRVHRG